MVIQALSSAQFERGFHNVFRWDIFQQFLYGDSAHFFVQGAWTTLWISVVAQSFGVVLGLFLALMRMSRFAWISWPARAYVWFFRGSPLLIQVMLLFYGLPRVFPGLPL